MLEKLHLKSHKIQTIVIWHAIFEIHFLLLKCVLPWKWAKFLHLKAYILASHAHNMTFGCLYMSLSCYEAQLQQISSGEYAWVHDPFSHFFVFMKGHLANCLRLTKIYSFLRQRSNFPICNDLIQWASLYVECQKMLYCRTGE